MPCCIWLVCTTIYAAASEQLLQLTVYFRFILQFSLGFCVICVSRSISFMLCVCIGFCFLVISQEIGCKGYIHNDIFHAEWDAKPYHSLSVNCAVLETSCMFVFISIQLTNISGGYDHMFSTTARTAYARSIIFEYAFMQVSFFYCCAYMTPVVFNNSSQKRFYICRFRLWLKYITACSVDIAVVVWFIFVHAVSWPPSCLCI